MGHEGIGSHTIIKKKLFLYFYFMRPFITPFQIQRSTVTICPQGLARKDLSMKSAWRCFLSPLSSGQSVFWVVHLGCSLPWDWMMTRNRIQW